jgi:hypothetical protein
VEQSFGPLAPLRSTERIGASPEDCEHLAKAFILFAERARLRIAGLEAALKACEEAHKAA